MKYLNLPAEYRPDRVARVKYGAEVKADPHVGSNRVRRFWNKEVERPVLYATDNGWRCIIWKSNDEWAWGYVDPEDIIVTKGVEVPPIDDGGDDVPPEELEEAQARINELEGALQVNLEVSEAALAGSDETVPLEDA